MTFSIQRFQAILTKEWKDAIRNQQILAMAAIPIFFSYVFSLAGEGGPANLSMTLLLSLSMIGAFVQSIMVAEEKEKHTLRVLMLSPASVSEVMLGKSILTAVFTLLSVAINIVFSNMAIDFWMELAIIVLLSLVIFLGLGTIIGLISRTVSESSVVGLPVLLIFIMAPLFAPMFELEWLKEAIKVLPTEHLSLAITRLADGGGFAEIKWNISVMLVWAIISWLLCGYVYSKNKLDK